MTTLVRGEGPKPADIAIIGEGPGYYENKMGRPFVGRAGDLLNFHLFKAGIKRDTCWVDNIVPFRCSTTDDEDRPPTEAEIKHHSLGLIRTLVEVQPKVVVAVGRTSTRWFLGDVDMEAVHGIPIRIKPDVMRVRRGVLDSGRSAPDRPPVSVVLPSVEVVVPCYHTAAALHDASGEMAALVADDFRQVGLFIKDKIPARRLEDAYPVVVYRRLSTVESVRKVLPVPTRTLQLYVDTEGFPGRPWSLQFSLEPGLGYLIKATDHEALAEFWYQSRRYVFVMHNALYDLTLLRDMNIDLVALGIPIEDTMLAAYLLRLEPQGLKPLGLRYAGMRMRSYDDLSEPYDKAILMAWLRRAIGRIYPEPEPVLEYDSKTGEPHIRKPQNVGRRIEAIVRDVDAGKLDKAGEPPHPRKRWAQVEPALQAQAVEVVGPVPVFSLDLVPEQEAVDYGCRDSDATARVFGPLWAKLAAMDLTGIYEMKRAILPMVERMMRIGMLIDPQHFLNMRSDIAAEQERLDLEIKRHTKGQWLNVDSRDQVAALLFDTLRLDSERLTKKGRVPSTDDKALEALVGAHPVVQLIIDRREVNTIDGFARDLPVFGDVDHRIHCTLRITRVAQGRLAASKPNLLGIPVRSGLGKRIREGFIAPPGRHLGSADLSQIEMMVMADESGDETLIRQITQGLDTHAETAIDILGCSRADSMDPKYREPAKRVQFGIITGITEVGLYEQLRLNHIMGYSKRDCADMLRAYFKLRPGVKHYIATCHAEARRNGYVRDRWGMIRYLPGVWSDIPYVRAEAERQTHSHKISGTAQGIIQRAMARVWQRILDEIWPAEVYCEVLLQVHDELIWEGEGDPEDWPAALISDMMREELTADTYLFKVPLKAKAATGLNWGELK